jgi:aminoglycoside 3-N-acetyltransferase I
VYIYDLAVDSRHQRKGIGAKLIAAITSFCKAEGMQEVFVQADRVDEHAVEFYRKTGATEEDVLHFYYDLQA